MYVNVQDEDRIVLRYEVPEVDTVNKNDYAPSGTEILLIHDIEVTSDYMVVVKYSSDGLYRLHWKGNLQTVLAKFADEVETWERDHDTALYPDRVAQ